MKIQRIKQILRLHFKGAFARKIRSSSNKQNLDRSKFGLPKVQTVKKSQDGATNLNFVNLYFSRPFGAAKIADKSQKVMNCLAFFE